MPIPGNRLVLASHNKKKTAELRAILAPLSIELLNLSDFPDAPEPEENGDTFEENAIIKAEAALRFTGLPAVADDSGLAVDALDGAPGVFSARFAGKHADDEANNRLLLEKLAGLPAEKRKAHFVSVIALALPDGSVRTFSGKADGTILPEARGAGGFGYDPLFLSDELGLTFAEASAEAKNRISHRGRALARMVEGIQRCAIHNS